MCVYDANPVDGKHMKSIHLSSYSHPDIKRQHSVTFLAVHDDDTKSDRGPYPSIAYGTDVQMRIPSAGDLTSVRQLTTNIRPGTISPPSHSLQFVCVITSRSYYSILGKLYFPSNTCVFIRDLVCV